MSELPRRTADTMSMVIGMTSPNGRMSKAAKKRAQKQLEVSLFGEQGFNEAIRPKLPQQPTEKENLLRQAKNLRELAARGMKPRSFIKQAEVLEEMAAKS